MSSSHSSQEESWDFLNRDAMESAGPVVQHEWIKELLTFDIHPAIPIPAERDGQDVDTTEPFRIAEIVTCTAVWLLQVHKVLPEAVRDTVELWGFDISTAQFPAPEMRPQNIQIHEHDANKPFPEEHHGKFYIVAVRLITEGLRGSTEHGEWDAAVKNAAALLKPGGHLQWIELLRSSLRLYNRPCGYGGGVSSKCTRQAVELFHKGFEKTLSPGPPRLPALCAKHGLEEVTLEVYPTDHHSDFQEMRRQDVYFLIEALGFMMYYIVDDDSETTPEENGETGGGAEMVAPVKWIKEKVEEVVDGAIEELESTKAMFLSWEMQVLVAKKPTP